MTVRENLELGRLHPPRRTAAVAADVDQVYDLFPILAERRAQAAGTLSGGEQQMLAIGRALMSRPRLLMLDEPSMGLSPIMMRTHLRRPWPSSRPRGTTLLLVEQNAQAALALADRGHVLETGRIVLSGTGADLLGDDERPQGLPRRGLRRPGGSEFTGPPPGGRLVATGQQWRLFTVTVDDCHRSTHVPHRAHPPPRGCRPGPGRPGDRRRRRPGHLRPRPPRRPTGPSPARRW